MNLGVFLGGIQGYGNYFRGYHALMKNDVLLHTEVLVKSELNKRVGTDPP